MNRFILSLLEGPCIFCKYDGPNYYQAGTHSPRCPFNQVGGADTRYNLLVNKLARLLKGR